MLIEYIVYLGHDIALTSRTIISGVLNLPQSLRHGSNDPHVRWTLIGLEDQLWGRATSIGGQLGMICLFQVTLVS